jgi:hypothetical protein
MKTFKLNFKNTSNNNDFVLIDAKSEIEAVSLFTETAPVGCITLTEDVTGKFVDANGAVK